MKILHDPCLPSTESLHSHLQLLGADDSRDADALRLWIALGLVARRHPQVSFDWPRWQAEFAKLLDRVTRLASTR